MRRLLEKFQILFLSLVFTMRLPVQVEGILFKRIEGKIRYLMPRRIPERGEFWQSVTGGLEEGETKIEALKREAMEETGIEHIVNVIEEVHYFEIPQPYLIKEYVFGVEILPDDKIALDKREHSEFRWCSFQEALKLLKWQENRVPSETPQGFECSSVDFSKLHECTNRTQGSEKTVQVFSKRGFLQRKLVLASI